MRAWPTREELIEALRAECYWRPVQRGGAAVVAEIGLNNLASMADSVANLYAEPIREREEALNGRADAMVAADFSTLTDVLTDEYQRGVAAGREQAAAFVQALKGQHMRSDVAAAIRALDRPTRPAGEEGETIKP